MKSCVLVWFSLQQILAASSLSWRAYHPICPSSRKRKRKPTTAREIRQILGALEITQPKGQSETVMSLRCCFANGMPTMVKAQITPARTRPRNNSHPKHAAQTTLAMVLKGVLNGFGDTSRPNGMDDTRANLNSCRPAGMPTTVTQQRIPTK